MASETVNRLLNDLGESDATRRLLQAIDDAPCMTVRTPIEPCNIMAAANIRLARLALKISQRELSRRVGLTQQASISNIENGHRRLTLDQIERFAAALDTTPMQLLKGVWW